MWEKWIKDISQATGPHNCVNEDMIYWNEETWERIMFEGKSQEFCFVYITLEMALRNLRGVGNRHSNMELKWETEVGVIVALIVVQRVLISYDGTD